MKSIRVSQMFLGSILLLLASLACAQLIPPSATKAVVPSEPAQTAEPTQTPKPQLGEMILEEKFTDNSNDWYVGKDTDTESAIEGGKYSVRILTQDYFSWFEAPISISEVDVTVDTEFTEGAPENASYGLLCHYKDSDNYYRFSIAPDGFYTIYKQVAGVDATLVPWTPTIVVQTGTGVVNKVRAICSESHLTLYANDTLLADVTDTSITGGSFALAAGFSINKKDDVNPIGVAFSNLTVRKPLAWQRPAGSLLTDSFDDNKNDWDVFKEDLASAQIENGQMVMKVDEADFSYYVYPALNLSNVDMTFDVVVQAGTPANTTFGAACRRIDADNRYKFDISADGSYVLNKNVNGKFENIIEWTTSTAIKTGVGETNHVRVVCSGSNLELYINDQLLISSQDTDLTAGGFALQTGRSTVDDKPVSVVFDNFEVHYPEK